MEQHVKILAVLHIILGGLGILAAMVIMLFFGGLAHFVGDIGDVNTRWFAGGVLGLIGAAATIAILVFSLPGFIAGIGLLGFQPWARILTIVLSALELPGFPFHTALGIYGLWVLLSNEGSALFRGPHPRTVA